MYTGKSKLCSIPKARCKCVVILFTLKGTTSFNISHTYPNGGGDKVGWSLLYPFFLPVLSSLDGLWLSNNLHER